MGDISFGSADLATHLGGTMRGAPCRVRRLATATTATADSVVVASAPDEVHQALDRGVGLLVVRNGTPVAAADAVAVIEVADPRLALAALSALFDRRPHPSGSVDDRAVIATGARLADGVTVDAHAVLGERAEIGAGSWIGAHCSIGEDVRIGRECRLHPNVVVYDGVVLGDRVTLHAGCVLGADGFGYATGPGGAVKIHHLGGVVVADDVEIGANSAVDRGTIEPTRIGERTKIDNHCQIGHNVQIGKDCLIAGMTGIAGSTVLGDGVIVGGYVAVADHLHIGAGATIAGRSGVTKDVPAAQTWAGFPAQPYRRWVRELYLRGRLEQIWTWVKGRERGA